MKREDLRVARHFDGLSVALDGADASYYEPVTQDEFDQLARAWAAERGWVEPPDCETCGGWRVGCMHEGRFSPQHCADATLGCPSCAGTGKQQMVALGGVNVDALAKAYRYGVHTPSLPERDQAWAVIFEQVEALLAALEGHTDE